jgi:uroporphyrinogen-III decarboxylase
LLRKDRALLRQFFVWYTDNRVIHWQVAVETDYQVFALADDVAYKNATMFDPEVFRDIVCPCYKRICDVVRKAGKYIFFHSDGFTEPYFPGLIWAGFHGVESLEPMAGMDLAHLKETYGNDLTLIGNMDMSQVMPLGTPERVEQEVISMMKAAKAGGGYIFSPCTDITDATPLENVLAMMRAVKKYGVY